MAYLSDHLGVSVPGGEDGFAQGGAGGAGVQVRLRGQGGADPGDAIKGDGGEWPVPFGRPKKGTGPSWSSRAGPWPLPRPRGGPRGDGRGGRAARRPGATGHSSSTQARNPDRVEAGARARRSSHKISPPMMASGVASSAASAACQVLVAGEGPGPDDADEGVAGQGVGDRGHGPDGQVPPARGGRDRVHEHAGADRGQVQRPGPDRAAAVQGERDAEAGEDQGGGVGDRGFQGGDHGQVAGGVDHPVLGGEAHRGRGRGQDAQPGGGVTQPQAGRVFAGLGQRPSKSAARPVAGVADSRNGPDSWHFARPFLSGQKDE